MNKSIIRTVGEGTFWASASTFFIKIVGLVSVFLILSRLGVSQYGVLELALSIVTLLSIFQLPGLDSLIVADMSFEKGQGELRRARNILSVYIVLQFCLAIVAWMLVFLGAPIFSSLFNVPSQYVQLVSFLFLLSPLRMAYGVSFRVNLDFIRFSFISFFEESIKLCVLWVIFSYTSMNIAAILIAMIISQTAALIIFMPAFLRFWFSLKGGSGTADKMRWWELLLDHGKWSILTNYAGNAGKSLRIWIIQRMLGPEAVGVYAVAIGLIGHVIALVPLSTILAPLLPQFVSDKERFTRLLSKGIKYQFIAHVLVAIGACIFAPPLLGYIFPEYQNVFPLFQVMLIALLPGAVTTVLNPAFVAFKLQKSLFISTVLKTLITVVLTFVGISLFGIWGVAVESIGTAFLQSIERSRSLRRNIPGITVSWIGLFRYDDDDKLILEKISSILLRRFP